MTATEQSRLHAWVEGHVQGVGFRYFVLDTAERLRLSGWVRNTFNEEVEILAEGPRADLELLIEALHRGPRSAVVTNVRLEWSTASGLFSKFSVAPTV